MSQFDLARIAQDFAALIGSDQVRASQGDESHVASLVLEPGGTQEVAAIVRKCEGDKIPLVPIGAARTCWRVERAPVAVSLARMNRIIAYEPEDMTIVAEAGATLADLNRMMADRQQRLPVDPPHAVQTTIGSLIAGAKAGPLRLSEGTVRDLLIGITFVGHEGRIVHAGGRVVKNVAGYDLMKVLTGSFGTLGIIVEATFKVRPIPSNYSLGIAPSATIEGAFAGAPKAQQAAQLFHCEVLGGRVAAPFAEAGRFALLAGFGGIRAEVEDQRAKLIAALGAGLRILTGADAAMAYQQLCDNAAELVALAAQIAVLPAELERCIAACDADFRAHALSGVAQVFHTGDLTFEDASRLVEHWRTMAHSTSGHLRLIAAEPNLRAKLEPFDSPPPSTMALMRRLKAAFDPHNIFNPGAFVGGI